MPVKNNLSGSGINVQISTRTAVVGVLIVLGVLGTGNAGVTYFNTASADNKVVEIQQSVLMALEVIKTKQEDQGSEIKELHIIVRENSGKLNKLDGKMDSLTGRGY